RRMEVYTALYDEKLKKQFPIVAKIITEETFHEELLNHAIVFGGNGAEKCSSVIHHPNASFDREIEPLAGEMNAMAQEKYQKGEFEDVAYFEPFYLKDFVTTTPKNKVLAKILEKKN
ncbi:MAG TPA: tRNA (adenosine(37)-N6)-threonylcarbamoyltransferase complex dimerization subunit type 1 TsaB, partial [Porphyromonadaceae bacterium]|nr:tRNA (adenosine(37)-N6)-threonylcarbamoyltransferase complex dimerization subunit type 1 TsaB [Porphyromonadaceae bacterium]